MSPPREDPPVDPAAQVEAFAALEGEARTVLLHIAGLLGELRFGTVLLSVQDGKVVQIEMAEKYRLR